MPEPADESLPTNPTESAASPSFSERLSSELGADTEPLATAGGAAADDGPAPAPSSTSPETQPEPEPVVSEPGFLDRLSALGFEGLADEREAQARVLEALQVQQQREAQYQAELRRQQQLAEYGNEYLRLAQDREFQRFQDWRQQQAQAQQAQQPPSWWSPPEVDEALLARYYRQEVNPETGQTEYRWAPDTPLDFRQNVERLAAYRQAWAQDLMANPPKAAERLWEGAIKPKIEQLLAEREQQQMALRQQQQAALTAQQIQQQHAPWFYATDPRTGGPLVDPVSNSYVPSQQGQMVLQYLSLLDQANRANDPGLRFQLASLAAMGQMNLQQMQQVQAPPPGQPVQAPPVQATAEQRKQELLQRNAGAGRIANRGAGAPGGANGHVANRMASFSERLDAELQAQGL